MNRSAITKGLGELLIRDKLKNKYWANEVTINWGLESECRVDFISYSPKNQSVSGIEQGIFTCYEVKSCVADFRSKNGHNFLGDKNYYVMTMEAYKTLKENGEIPAFAYEGIYVALPNQWKSGRMLEQELESPTEFTGDIEDWKLHCIVKSRKKDRGHSLSQLLFMMLRSGYDSKLIEENNNDN